MPVFSNSLRIYTRMGEFREMPLNPPHPPPVPPGLESMLAGLEITRAKGDEREFGD